MPPTLRSSATTTPTKTVSFGTITPKSTPRKQHQCKTCGRPRAGHPRQGCPFEEDSGGTQKEPEVITHALESMNIDSSPIVAGRKYRGRSSLERKPELFPEASLASLSSTSKEIIEGLMKPGIMSDGSDEDCAEMKRKILESLTSPKKKKSTPSGARMPGTLHTPNPSFFEPTQATQESYNNGETIPSEKSQTTLNRHIVRSLSVEERESFLADLNEASKLPPACVYVFPMRDIPRIKQSAEKAGFHACVVNVSVDGANKKKKTDGWLILGREKHAVQLLKAEVECRRNQDDTEERRGQTGGTLRAVAGGAVVGAFATFTGLAFS